MQVINLGKEPVIKAYRLYDPKSKRVYVSRDITFEEPKYWSWNNQEGRKSNQLGSFSVHDTHVTWEENQNSPRSTHTNIVGNDQETTPLSTGQVQIVRTMIIVVNQRISDQ